MIRFDVIHDATPDKIRHVMGYGQKREIHTIRTESQLPQYTLALNRYVSQGQSQSCSAAIPTLKRGVNLSPSKSCVSSNSLSSISLSPVRFWPAAHMKSHVKRHIKIHIKKTSETKTRENRYGHTYSKSMDQRGKVANPARGQLNGENEYFAVLVRA